MKKIMFVSAGRSDYGIMRNIILKVSKSRNFKTSLIITGSHLSKKFGKTIREVKQDSIKNIYKIYSSKNDYKTDNTNFFISKIIKDSDIILRKETPDFIVILGDRYEMLAISLAAFNRRIKIIHFCGGSETRGANDDEYRNCISELAHAHFVETKYHKTNLISKNIKKNKIFLYGAPALENLKNVSFLSKRDILKKFKIFNLKKKIIVSTFHPETKKNKNENLKNLEILLKFLKKPDFTVIFTYPNADEGFGHYIKKINKIKNKNFYVFESLGIKNYYNLLKIADCLIGNSSSGIIESRSFNLPTLNLGDRQLGRFYNKNVIHCRFKKNEIEKSFLKSQDKKFKKKFLNFKNIYKLNYKSEKFLNILSSI